jgi:hypothetical protein
MRLRPPSTVAGLVQIKNKNAEENEMKTVALATLVLATAAPRIEDAKSEKTE